MKRDQEEDDIKKEIDEYDIEIKRERVHFEDQLRENAKLMAELKRRGYT